MKPRHTNSTGNTRHLRMMQALGSGTAVARETVAAEVSGCR